MKRCFIFLLAAVLLFGTGCTATTGDAPFGDRIRNAGQLVVSIRQGLKRHAETITIRFDYGSVIFEELNEVIDEWVEAALADTGAPDEGDYIRYQYGGYEYTSSYQAVDGRYEYTVVLEPQYYCYLFQEEEAGKAVEERYASYGFDKKTSDWERIRTIYEDICQSVSYDSVHKKNPYYHLCSTAYAALVRRCATCQGYCTACYRLLKKAGIDCRIVTGETEREKLHAWLIVKLKGQYYQLDPTWDAGEETYQYFLAGTDQMSDRIPDAKYTTEEFITRYPQAKESWKGNG